MREATREKIEKVDELVKGGMSLSSACEKVGLAFQTYRDNTKPSAVKAKPSSILRRPEASSAFDEAFLKRVMKSNLPTNDKFKVITTSLR